MNKSVKKVACLLLSALTAVSLFACGGGGGGGNNGNSGNSGSDSSGGVVQKYNPETRPLVMATEPCDGNFNPFFATSAMDSTMVAMTQIGMLITDDKGYPYCGEDEPTAALALQEKQSADKNYTDYSFIIKNDVKFSDGKPLTIKDILFNLYVYLDPAYMGSATLYSTDIVGLQAYRKQDPSLQDSVGAGGDEFTMFEGPALERLKNLLNYLDLNVKDGEKPTLTAEIEGDIEQTKKFFAEEVKTDWTLNTGILESYEDEYTFTEDWQVYYYAEGLVRRVRGSQGYLRDKNNKFITNITPANVTLSDGNVYDSDHPNWSYTDLASEIEAAKVDEDQIQKYITSGATRDKAIEYVVRDTAINAVYETYTESNPQLYQVAAYWGTNADLYDLFVAEEKTAYYESIKGEDGSLRVATISGITTSKTTKDFEGNSLGEEHDVLNVRINGVDPKAIYNFGFSVAPMHYYSDTYKGVDYINEADGKTKFGVAFGDSGFFETVLKKNSARPMGAGSYKASGTSANDFWGTTGYVNFVRNEHFYTVGEGLENAKIKYLKYREITSDSLMQYLKAGNVDIGQPNATPTNLAEIRDSENLAQKTSATNGYGYVGINPKYVPDIEVRQAIMMALNTEFCIDYYSGHAKELTRPMSLESWVWDYIDADATQRQPFYEFTSDPEIIKSLIAGIDKSKLELTFTIAGATNDHPAYHMFEDAKDFLNDCGFNITITTDPTALKRLATGELAVWAAAWSSTADPDMYQVYHKQSKATSINNWGYKTIFADSTTQFRDEKSIINELSDLIVDARKTADRQFRSEMYAEALDLVMELAVEFPIYQRDDCVAYNKSLINAATLNNDPTAFSGVTDRIWEINYL